MKDTLIPCSQSPWWTCRPSSGMCSSPWWGCPRTACTYSKCRSWTCRREWLVLRCPCSSGRGLVVRVAYLASLWLIINIYYLEDLVDVTIHGLVQVLLWCVVGQYANQVERGSTPLISRHHQLSQTGDHTLCPLLHDFGCQIGIRQLRDRLLSRSNQVRIEWQLVIQQRLDHGE